MAVRIGVVFLVAVLASSLPGCGNVLFSGEAVRGAIGTPFRIFSAQAEPDLLDPIYPRIALDVAFLPITSASAETWTLSRFGQDHIRERATLHQRADGSISLSAASARPFAAPYSTVPPRIEDEPARLREALLPFLVPSCQSPLHP